MRLLIDARPLVDAPQGGVGRVAFHLVKAYAETFPQDELVCATTGAGSPKLPEVLQAFDNVTHAHIQVPNKLWSSACIAGLASLDRTVMREVGACDAAFFPNIGFFGTPIIPHAILLHDLSFLIEPNWFTPKQRMWHEAVRARHAIRSATHLFAVSRTTARDARTLLDIPEQRIKVLPMGSTLAHSPATSNMQLPKRFILALGAGDARKNAATAVEAVRAVRLQGAHHDLELVLIGRTRHRHRESWIHHLEDVRDDQMAELYARAALFVYPSWYEGYGLPLHEAAAHGTPRIASSSSALPETAPKGTMFANPAKPHQWAEAIELALKAERSLIEPNERGWDQAAYIVRENLLA